ncbi:Thiamin diphosphate-binding protein [Kockovaella imperatae]|uniref:Thiamin diphosphate-binding protein n=1 Tax=Kockovaella imperatae TaxID=4999 RepID=A0A1Y1U798_9TREE|nr:Thiamin diphosphate-binding protein [Kockovaella imperatae]ORX33900.1 Thiamin diphosphate-binding protein [Kockovaella imperatae]
MPSQIEFATYVVQRLKQCGIKQVFGVPGDYNLELLDYFEKEEGIDWVGNANELNAAYASDGYARVKGTLAVLITTFGVGELSALCGIAGSLAERLPILHIVGAPSTSMQHNRTLLHHTLNTESTFTTFSTMSEPLSCSQALLNQIDPSTDTAWTEAFDKVLKDVLEQCRPGYVEIPTDAVHKKVSDEGLQEKLPHPHSAPPPESTATGLPLETKINTVSQAPSDHPVSDSADKVTEHVVQEITARFVKAERPVVLVDACAGRFGMAGEVRKLVESCGIRFFETPMGKSLLDEHHPLFGGCYAGANSLEAVRKEVESADFVLYVGALKSDFNSGSFSVNIDTAITIELHSFTTNIGYASYPTTDIRHILPLLRPSFEAAATRRTTKPIEGESLDEKRKDGRIQTLPKDVDENAIKHAWLWPTMGEWFKDTDIIITETGTSSFGLTNVALPSHSTYVAQILWGAIGWSVGACLGCALAAKESEDNRRTVLFVGDGSLQLTLQEIGTMLKTGVCPYLFVLNNDGYEIERQIHGWDAKYNDIQLYDHQLLLPFLAGKKCKTPYESFEVHTPAELSKLLADEAFNVPDKLRLIEVYMPRGDSPEGLIKQAKLTAEANAKV